MNEKIINKLIKLTKKAIKKNEIAVAAVITNNNKIISSAYNKRQTIWDVTAHAEVLAIRKAERKIRDWRLNGYDLYVTLEPCEMCKKIIEEARIDNCYYFIKKPKNKKINRSLKVSYLQTKENEKLKKYFQKSFIKLR